MGGGDDILAFASASPNSAHEPAAGKDAASAGGDESMEMSLQSSPIHWTTRVREATVRLKTDVKFCFDVVKFKVKVPFTTSSLYSTWNNATQKCYWTQKKKKKLLDKLPQC